jgi:hypothetical protein
MKTLFEWLPPSTSASGYPSIGTSSIGRPDLEIEYMFRALIGRNTSATCRVHAAWVNEAREIPWSVIKPLAGAEPAAEGRRAGEGRPHADTNPPDTDSWWYNLFEERRPDNAELFRQPSGARRMPRT